MRPDVNPTRPDRLTGRLTEGVHTSVTHMHERGWHGCLAAPAAARAMARCYRTCSAASTRRLLPRALNHWHTTRRPSAGPVSVPLPGVSLSQFTARQRDSYRTCSAASTRRTVVTVCAQPLAHDILGTHLYRRGARRVADLAPRRSRIAIDVREGVDQTLVEREVEKPSGPRWLR